jgi:transposase
MPRRGVRLTDKQWARIEPLLPRLPQRARQEAVGCAGRRRSCMEPSTREKGGSDVGKTKRGKGSKCMVVVDGNGVPRGVSVAVASPAELQLAEQTLASVSVPRGGPGRLRSKPDRVVADRGYDRDPLRERLAQKGIEWISPHRSNRVRPRTQDGRALRRYRRRWIVERAFAWLGNFRRLIVRRGAPRRRTWRSCTSLAPSSRCGGCETTCMRHPAVG